MKQSLAIVVALALFEAALPAKAQDQPSKLEVYGGYYYVRFNVNANLPGVAPSATYNGNGGGGQLAYNANHWLGVVRIWNRRRGKPHRTNRANVGGAFPKLFPPAVNRLRCRIWVFRRGNPGRRLAQTLSINERTC